ncbi:DUF3261 domain-containing protein [Pseudoxanthomonas putridarboris]|uniref:DUF3261 domain-containing protein n=1 Tax=Pseudoxanthomonas putridarboris TaxID=752605 RepID=A0ABU9IZJ0_9GAMM
MRRLIAMLSLCLLLAACPQKRLVAPPAELPALRLSPASLGQELAVQQRLVFRYGQHERELDALLEVDADEVRLLVQAMGQSGVRLQWDGRELIQQRAPWLPASVRGERVLDDLQFSLWPLESIRAVLPGDWQVEERDGVRELRHGGRAWLSRTRVDATTLQLRNHAEGYDLRIESVAGGDGSP